MFFEDYKNNVICLPPYISIIILTVLHWPIPGDISVAEQTADILPEAGVRFLSGLMTSVTEKPVFKR